MVRISSFNGVVTSREDLDANIRYQLQQQRHHLGIDVTPPERIADEYNKPILDNQPKERRVFTRRTLFMVLRQHDLVGLEAHLKALFAGLPHDWYRNNPIACYEGHTFTQAYASVFYSHFAAPGVGVTVEDASSSGKPIHLVGVEFSRVERQIVAFEVETLASLS
ncbi:hypothetical protein [Vreelandella andesensis]|uniref:hypothetical protein n=1 Tax=Vreelandella andesensis TaxID=447567 RepID=UPI001FC97402|nr:hypothetical protein [Halomonas andesensis]